MDKTVCRILFFLAVVLLSCDNENKIRINGNVENGKKNIIYLIDPLQSIRGVNDSIKLKHGGRFSFTMESNRPEFVELVYNEKRILLIAHPGDEISIFTHDSTFSENYTVSGSKDSEEIFQLNKRLQKTLKSVDSLKTIYKSEISDSEKMSIESKIDSVYKAHKKFIISFVLKDMKSLSNIVALHQQIDNDTYFLNLVRDVQYFKIINDTLKKYYPNVPFVQMLDRNTSKMLGQYNTAVLMSKATEIREAVPEIKLPDTKGDTITLSSLKGKTVLLLFWSPNEASNIRYNRQLIPIYNKYKNKGFDVYQATFEMNTQRWKEIVRFEELPWKSVCDENGSRSKYISLYNIKGLPTSYLLDSSQENILGKNLNIRQLDLKLNYILNN